jgi:hypothetical protein
MNKAFINDVIGLERNYLSCGDSIPKAHVNRLNKILNEMSDEEKDACAIYAKKLRKMTNDMNWGIDELRAEMDRLMELLKHGKKIIMHVTCSEMSEMMSNLVAQSRHVERRHEGDFSLHRDRVDFVLTRLSRDLLPSLIAQSVVVGDVIEETDEFIF